jgi:hypothetical protein
MKPVEIVLRRGKEMRESVRGLNLTKLYVISTYGNVIMKHPYKNNIC